MNVREVSRAAVLMACGFVLGCLFSQSILDYRGKNWNNYKLQSKVHKYAVKRGELSRSNENFKLQWLRSSSNQSGISQQSVSTQRALREHSVSTQWALSEHSESIQSEIRELSKCTQRSEHQNKSQNSRSLKYYVLFQMEENQYNL